MREGFTRSLLFVSIWDPQSVKGVMHVQGSKIFSDHAYLVLKYLNFLLAKVSCLLI